GKAILGVLMHELGRPLDAIACLAEALGAEPCNPSFVEALAAAQATAGTLDRAAATLAAGIARVPAAPALRNAAMLLEIRRRDFPAAARLGTAARAAGAADACGFGLLGHALSSLARHEEAAEAYEEALKLAPEDPYVRHLVATAGARPGADRAPSPYVRAVFDGYADRFESHLVALGYRIPGLVRAALAGTDATGPLLDLGCGTGLIGLALADLPLSPLHGVDLSPRMLARAAAKNLYAALHEADLLSFLEAEGPAYGVIVAADVLCYFGDLAPVLAAIAARLRPGGPLLLSCETDPAGTGPWSLGPHGRYTHHPDHLRQAAAAAALTVTTLRAETQRFQNDVPVPGLFGILTR
ncbi:MAG: class I SAM-dependent DNA methyltransferase, partial [Acetobacteraceae bacterium]